MSETFRQFIAGLVAPHARADAAAGAQRQLLQALRARLVRADGARLGARQPHLRAARRRPRQRHARREPRRRRRRQPVPGVRRAARGRPRRHRRRLRARARAGRAPATTRATSRTCPRRCTRRASCSPARRWRARRFGDEVVDHYLNAATVELDAVRRRRHRLGAAALLRAPVSRPRIGIARYRTHARWTHWDLAATVIPQGYVEGVRLAGGVPILLPPTPEGAEDPGEVLDGIDGAAAHRRARPRPGALRRRARGGHGRADARAPGARRLRARAAARGAARASCPCSASAAACSCMNVERGGDARAGHRARRARPRAAPPAARHLRAPPRHDRGRAPSRPGVLGEAVDDIHSHHHQGIAERGGGPGRLGRAPTTAASRRSRIRRSRSAWPCSGTPRKRTTRPARRSSGRSSRPPPRARTAPDRCQVPRGMRGRSSSGSQSARW